MGIEDQLFHWLTETLTSVFNAIGWTGVVVIMALESANIPIPSEVTMPLAGWLLVEAKGGALWTAIFEGGFFGGLGCLIGSVGSYALGAWGGRPFLEKYGPITAAPLTIAPILAGHVRSMYDVRRLTVATQPLHRGILRFAFDYMHRRPK